MKMITIFRFVKKEQVSDDVYTFSFALSKRLRFKAGQHGLFVLPGLYRPHPFSLSSSPDEEYISFSTHTATGSAFKRRLMSLKPGNKMIFLGPVMNFTFSDTASSHVLLAQGIGITPFRSMLLFAHNRQLPITTTLIHVDSKDHAFRSLTERCATSAYYPVNTDDFQQLTKQQDANQTFYLSGSPRFISATKLLLKDMGVHPKAIKTDSFWGY
jgi:glycine betaine catabolism B